MSSRDWTIDGIAHSIGHPGQRQKFLRDINLTPLADLPAVLDRWVKHVTALEAARPAVEEARAHFTALGNLPAEMQHTDEAASRFGQWQAEARESGQGRGAA